jgi:hypothetical protein
VLDEGIDHRRPGDARARPGVDQPAVERDRGQDVDERPGLDPEGLDDVEAVELRLARANGGQVPAPRRSRPTEPLTTIERAAPLEDPADRPQRWHRPGQARPGEELLADRDGTVLTEHALLTQRAAEIEDRLFEPERDAARPTGGSRPIRPVDLVERVVSGALECPLDGPEPDLERPRCRPERRSAPDGRDDRSSAGRVPTRLFLSRSRPPQTVSGERTDPHGEDVADPDVLALARLVA